MKFRDEKNLDSQLAHFLLLAELGDAPRARSVYLILHNMLTEKETSLGKYWLTEFGKSVLAERIKPLSKTPFGGDKMASHLFDSLCLKPQRGNPRNSADVHREFLIYLRVGDELEAQSKRGEKQNITKAAKIVASAIDVNLKWGTVRNTFYKFQLKDGVLSRKIFPESMQIVEKPIKEEKT